MLRITNKPLVLYLLNHFSAPHSGIPLKDEDKGTENALVSAHTLVSNRFFLISRHI